MYNVNYSTFSTAESDEDYHRKDEKEKIEMQKYFVSSEGQNFLKQLWSTFVWKSRVGFHNANNFVLA